MRAAMAKSLLDAIKAGEEPSKIDLSGFLEVLSAEKRRKSLQIYVRRRVEGDEDEGYTFGLQGYFQGVKFNVADIDLMGGDSPIEAVMRAVLGLEEGDELSSISVKTKDGRMIVRSWDRDS
jgi:hypothetical protein